MAIKNNTGKTFSSHIPQWSIGNTGPMWPEVGFGIHVYVSSHLTNSSILGRVCVDWETAGRNSRNRKETDIG